MTPDNALVTLHADYIGGPNANYRQWYFASRIYLDDAIDAEREQNPGLLRLPPQTRHSLEGNNRELFLAQSQERWQQYMNNKSHRDRLRQLALYLLCWGEAAQVRLCPETLCFIFKCADDYYRSPECQNRIEPVPEGLYLRAVIKPLYRFIRDEGYEVRDGKFVSRERDHDQIIGYDDVNQLFWYPSGIARIILTDKVRNTTRVDGQLAYGLADAPDGFATLSEVHVSGSYRLEFGVLQNILREAILRPPSCQFQSYMGAPLINVLVFYVI
jgi:hypothetical protein